MEEYSFNVDNWEYFCSFARWYPDLFLDLIKPQKGGLNLHLDQRIYLRAMLRFMSLYGVFPRGYGKCVAGDTLIFTDSGIKEIGELFNYNESGIETLYNTHIGIVNRYGKKENTKLGLYSGYCKTKMITTDDGFQICGTYNHPILVMESTGCIEFKKLEDIRSGDYVVINRNNNMWGNINNINVSDNLNLWISSLSNQSKSHLNIRELPQKLTPNISKILGYLIGDGCMTMEKDVLFTNKDICVINNFIHTMENDFKVKNVRKVTNIDYRISDMYLRKYLELIGMDFSDAPHKSVPKVILSSSKENVASFLTGLFDTDGTVDSGSVSITSASEHLIKQVQFLLLNFGIISRKKDKKHKDKTYYSLFISGKDVEFFSQYIGFDIDYKQEKLFELCKKIRNTNKDILPHQKQLVQKYYNDAKKYNTYIYDPLYHILKGNNNLTYQKLDWLLSLNKSHKCLGYDKLKDLANTHYYFSKVTSISDGENHVYDFHIESTHSFVSNGFVSHNTFNEVLASELACIFYPEITIALTAQTKENAAELLKDKHSEIMKFYPMLKNEVAKENFSKNDATIVFKNGSSLDNLANAQSSKGQRRRRMNEEESALIDNETFLDALLPIVEVPRVCVGKYSIIDPEELNQQINFFTTAGFKGSDEYQRSIDMVKDMINLKGKIVLGSSFWLPCWYGRGSTKSQIFQKKRDMTTVSFAQNYESKWVGAATGALVNVNKLIDCRSLLDTVYEAKDNEEYYIGVDVARSESTANNQSSAAVVRVKRNDKNNKVKSLEVVNAINISNTMNFTNQAIEIKRLKKRYNARMVIVDGNGLGSGLVDQLLKNAEDPVTGDDLGCWNTVNTDNEPESNSSESCLFDLKAQSYQNKVVSYFIDAVDSGKLRLLRQRKETDFSQSEKDDYVNKVLPFIQTDFMVEEIANLKLKTLPSGSITVEKTVSRMNKDRFSCLSYAIFYIMEFTNNAYESVNELELLEQYTFL